MIGQVLARGLNALLGVAVTIALVRGLGPRGFGDWSTLLAVITMVGYLGSLGLESVAVRHASIDPQHESKWLSAMVSLQLIISIPVTIIALIVMLGIAHDSATELPRSCCRSRAFCHALGSIRAVFQLRIRNSWTAGFELAQRPAVGVGCALRSPPPAPG